MTAAGKRVMQTSPRTLHGLPARRHALPLQCGAAWKQPFLPYLCLPWLCLGAVKCPCGHVGAWPAQHLLDMCHLHGSRTLQCSAPSCDLTWWVAVEPSVAMHVVRHHAQPMHSVVARHNRVHAALVA
eukprot:364709-Chlamydomonas_euryale.AAC.8